MRNLAERPSGRAALPRVDDADADLRCLALCTTDSVYLDYGGSGLYTASHLSSTREYLSRALLANPHSDPATSAIVDAIREQTLRYLGVNSKTHSIVFTYNTSTALHLIGSIFPFTPDSELTLMMDNHNSTLGLREKAKARGARFSVVQPADATAETLECCCSAALRQQHAATPADTVAPATTMVHPCLFVFPGESNFDGRIYDLSLADKVHAYNHPRPSDAATAAADSARATCAVNPLGLHRVGPQHRWYTLVDASKLAATSPLDISRHEGVDFVIFSFYKMFGFPTGLAALVIKNSTAQELWKAPSSTDENSATVQSSTFGASFASLTPLRSYFAGGTVNAVIADEDFHVARTTGKLHELLEDGTIAFTSIVSIPYGLQLFRTLQPSRIHQHTCVLIRHLFDWLQAQRYENGQPLCKFYGARTSANTHQYGPTLNLNFLDQHGRVIGYKTVEKLAAVNRIHLRSGSFCNPGACQLNFPISSAQIRSNLTAGYACWEDGENLGGVVNGSIRVTLGWSSRWEDIARFQLFVSREITQVGKESFISNGTAAATLTSSHALPALPASAEPALTPFSFQLPSYFTAPPSVPSVDSSPLQPPPEASRVLQQAESTSVLDSPADAAAASTAVLVPPLSYAMPASPYVLSSLTVYPIKSCAGLTVPRWLIESSVQTGSTLFLDREFVLLDAQGVALSQKLLPQLQLIRPAVNLRTKTLTLSAPDMPPLEIDLSADAKTTTEQTQSASLCDLQVCGRTSLGYQYDGAQHAHITEWLTAVVGKYTCLARRSPQLQWPSDDALASLEHTDGDALKSATISHLNNSTLANGTDTVVAAASGTDLKERRSFANEDDFLLISAASVREVERRLHEYVAGHAVLTPHPNDASIPPSRFRPNFVVDSAASQLTAFAEDTWTSVRIGSFQLRVKGGCGRCVMVNIHPTTGDRHSSLYALLNTCRKKDGRVLFGTLLSDLAHVDQPHDERTAETRWWPIRVGQPVTAQ